MGLASSPPAPGCPRRGLGVPARPGAPTEGSAEPGAAPPGVAQPKRRRSGPAAPEPHTERRPAAPRGHPWGAGVPSHPRARGQAQGGGAQPAAPHSPSGREPAGPPAPPAGRGSPRLPGASRRARPRKPGRDGALSGSGSITFHRVQCLAPYVGLLRCSACHAPQWPLRVAEPCCGPEDCVPWGRRGETELRIVHGWLDTCLDTRKHKKMIIH